MSDEQLTERWDVICLSRVIGMEGQGGYFNPYLPYQNVQMHFNANTNQSPFTQGNNSPTVSSQTSSIDSSSASDSPTSTNQPLCLKWSSTSPDVEPSKGKKTNDKFSEEQQKALVNLWAEKYVYIFEIGGSEI